MVAFAFLLPIVSRPNVAEAAEDAKFYVYVGNVSNRASRPFHFNQDFGIYFTEFNPILYVSVRDSNGLTADKQIVNQRVHFKCTNNAFYLLTVMCDFGFNMNAPLGMYTVVCDTEAPMLKAKVNGSDITNFQTVTGECVSISVSDNQPNVNLYMSYNGSSFTKLDATETTVYNYGDYAFFGEDSAKNVSETLKFSIAQKTNEEPDLKPDQPGNVKTKSSTPLIILMAIIVIFVLSFAAFVIFKKIKRK